MHEQHDYIFPGILKLKMYIISQYMGEFFIAINLQFLYLTIIKLLLILLLMEHMMYSKNI